MFGDGDEPHLVAFILDKTILLVASARLRSGSSLQNTRPVRQHCNRLRASPSPLARTTMRLVVNPVDLSDLCPVIWPGDTKDEHNPPTGKKFINDSQSL